MAPSITEIDLPLEGLGFSRGRAGAILKQVVSSTIGKRGQVRVDLRKQIVWITLHRGAALKLSEIDAGVAERLFRIDRRRLTLSGPVQVEIVGGCLCCRPCEERLIRLFQKVDGVVVTQIHRKKRLVCLNIRQQLSVRYAQLNDAVNRRWIKEVIWGSPVS